MTSTRLSALFLASASVAAGITQCATAELTVSVRALGTYADIDYNGFQPLSFGNTPQHLPIVSTGQLYSLSVFAQVTQTGQVGDPATGAAGWPVFGSIDGRIVSQGQVMMDFYGSWPDFSTQGSGFQPGAFANLDGDSDIDIGNTDANSGNPAGWVMYRSAASTGRNGPGTTTPSGGSFYGPRPDGVSGAPTPIPGGFEYHLGEINMVITSNNSFAFGSTVKWEFRPNSGSAVWYENANRVVVTSKISTVVSYTGGTLGTSFAPGASVLVGAPEPASLGLAALAGLSLLARRKNPIPKQ